jgi:hypothetical protein
LTPSLGLEVAPFIFAGIGTEDPHPFNLRHTERCADLFFIQAAGPRAYSQLTDASAPIELIGKYRRGDLRDSGPRPRPTPQITSLQRCCTETHQGLVAQPGLFCTSRFAATAAPSLEISRRCARAFATTDGSSGRVVQSLPETNVGLEETR